MYRNYENAVSPVVGVMLMLVVTIIIAAIVSAFAGGLGSSQDKVPQVTLKAEFSVTDGMKIYHNGGDTLTVGDFKILLSPSKNFDSIESVSYINDIDLSLIQNGPDPSSTNWYRPNKGGRDVPRFAPGEIAYINATNSMTQTLTPNLMYDSSNYGINQTSKVGATFFLDFITKDGKKIARVEVPIKP
ncbi:MAG: type IV pilin N-terminal domain-containing protein [Acetobacterium sp.]|nr:type IV pilin N-terminal domain-containing protein [Acetobacterium sp.]